MTDLGIGPASAPAVEHLVEGSRRARGAAPPRRELLTELALSVGFVAVATAIAAGFSVERALSPGVLLLLVALYAAASHVRLEVGAGYTVPTQLVFVPMLFFLPPAVVPAAVVLGIVAGNLPGYVTGSKHPSRVLFAFGDSWHALAPALVFAIWQPGTPGLEDWALVAAALAGQVLVDVATSTAREWIGCGIPPAIQMRVLAGVYLADVCLAPIGLFAALVAGWEPFALLLLLPVGGLILVYADERRQRITSALELSQAYRGTTLLLGDVVDADDAYTGSHSRSVVELALAVADRLRVDPRERREVEFTALLHDVGKIAIPKEILNKPGALDDHEWTVMRTHTIRGQELLDRVGGVLSDVGTAVRASHERFDGTGYPDGLAGTAIPLAARIVSCCDAFNAMTTKRPYRMPMSREVAVRELVENAGTQFDPKVVRTLVALVMRGTRGGLPHLPRELDAAAVRSSRGHG